MEDRNRTLIHQLAGWAAAKPTTPALHARGASGDWSTWTWADYWRDVRSTAKGLMALGLEPGHTAALIGKNRPEWVICQFGIMAAGGIPAPIYATNTVEQAAYIVSQSESRIAIADVEEQAQKFLEAEKKGLMRVHKIVTMDEVPGHGDHVMSLSALKKLGESVADAELDRRIAALDPDATAFLIYTSGTTALPKGAELTHRGMVAVGASAAVEYPHLGEGEIGLSYLPLCHIAEQIFTNILPMARSGEVYFCPELAQLKDYLVAVRPTVLLGVPRVWEKFEAALRARFEETAGLKRTLLDWSRKTELECFRRQIALDKDVDTFGRRLADRLVLGKLKKALGLDRLKLAASGAAPISTSTLEFFASIGVLIHEGFGMTETTGIAAVQKYKRPVFGTVGHALHGVEAKIADDGELLLKGPGMAKGYYKKPEDSKALFTPDGWLKTGDLARLENGLLQITGRKKDLIITAGGKNIAPAEIEQFLSGIPGVGQVMVVGDRRPYCTLLIALDPEGYGALADAAGVPRTSIDGMVEDPKINAFVHAWIEEHCNKKVARYQTIKRFAILPAPMSIGTGELTPTMKVKRNIVLEKYRAVVEKLYAGEPAGERARVDA